MIVDADAHFFEPLDWFEDMFPELDAKLPPFDLLEMVAGAVLPSPNLLRNIPETQRPNLIDVIPAFLQPVIKRLEGKRLSVKECQSILRDASDPDTAALGFLWREYGASDADERIDFMNQRGIGYQFMNPSAPGGHPLARAAKTGDADLIKACSHAWNTWATETLSKHSDRLWATARIDLSDPDEAVAEMTRLRERGSRAFNPGCAPAGGRALSHPDNEKIWAAAEDLGMAAILHIGTGWPDVSSAWANDGSGEVFNYLNLCKTLTHQTPELALGSLILGGVMERHPNLPFVACEFGISWMPHWLEVLDSMSYTLSVDFRPAGQKGLRLKPSEYVERQVFVTALPDDKLNPTLSLVRGAVAFSTDYPHPEGSEHARSVFDEQLADVPQARRDEFYGARLGALMKLN